MPTRNCWRRSPSWRSTKPPRPPRCIARSSSSLFRNAHAPKPLRSNGSPNSSSDSSRIPSPRRATGRRNRASCSNSLFPNELKSGLAQVDNLVLVLDADDRRLPVGTHERRRQAALHHIGDGAAAADLELPPPDRRTGGNGRLHRRRPTRQRTVSATRRARRTKLPRCTPCWAQNSTSARSPSRSSRLSKSSPGCTRSRIASCTWPDTATTSRRPLRAARPAAAWCSTTAIFLTAVEVGQMQQVPELVFLNCCYIGQTGPEDDRRRAPKPCSSIAWPPAFPEN